MGAAAGGDAQGVAGGMQEEEEEINGLEGNHPHADGDAFGTERRAEAREEDLGSQTPQGPAPEPLRERLRSRRAYWHASMRAMGVVCALTLSILSDGCRLEWDPITGLLPRVHKRNAQSAARARFSPPPQPRLRKGIAGQ